MRTRTLAQVVVIGMLLALVSGGTVAQGAGEPGVVHFTAVGDFGSNNNTNAVLAGMAAADPDLTLALGDLSYGAVGQELALVRPGHLADGRRIPVRADRREPREQRPERQYQRLLGLPAESATRRRGHLRPAVVRRRPAGRSARPLRHGLAGAPVPRLDLVLRGRFAALQLDRRGHRQRPGQRHPLGCRRRAQALLLHGRLHLRDRRRLHEHADQQAGRPGPARARAHVPAHPPARAPFRLLDGARRLRRHRLPGRHRRRHEPGLRHGVRDLRPRWPGAAHRQQRRHRGRRTSRRRRAATRTPPTASSTSRSPPTTSRPPSCPVQAARSPTPSRSTRAIPPANVPPTAAFTSSTNNLTATFDGRGSSDPEGPIASYSWDFGDSTTPPGTGAQPSHTYAAAGDYDVTLTVTDGAGATDTETHTVTVTDPPPGPVDFVVDTFGRTVANGWGSADTGGAWTISRHGRELRGQQRIGRDHPARPPATTGRSGSGRPPAPTPTCG